ncbi:MAG: hypothetical protein JEZ08_25335 [Clostridiales bacterium]|nr:hypothetical protein [Clostridiales bacterium]
MNFEKSIIESMEKYFEDNSVDKWKGVYEKKIGNIHHDEPWLTLVGLYSIFNNQNTFNRNHIEAFQSILDQSGFDKYIKVDSVERVSIEKILPEIKPYRVYLYELLKKNDIHLYPDRNNTLKKRLKEYTDSENKKQASLEGNTNLDAQIIFSVEGRKKYMFIEAKFLSDIDTKTTYNPVRNQVIRNIDAMIDFVLTEKEKNKDIDLADVYFTLLTPKVFRTEKFNGNKKSNLDIFTPQKARFYCYVMDEYKNPLALKRDLPHRQLSDDKWEMISKHLGWITFDDMYIAAKEYRTIESHQEEFESFFRTRKLY